MPVQDKSDLVEFMLERMKEAQNGASMANLKRLAGGLPNCYSSHGE
jgi:hypothetical protein